MGKFQERFQTKSGRDGKRGKCVFLSSGFLAFRLSLRFYYGFTDAIINCYQR